MKMKLFAISMVSAALLAGPALADDKDVEIKGKDGDVKIKASKIGR